VTTSRLAGSATPSVGILGGGALGLSAAYRLVKAGVRVTVLEKDNVVGGLAASFPVGGSHLEKYYHHLFRSDRTITALVDELGLGSKLVWKKAPTSSLVNGQRHTMDATHLLTFAPLPPLDRLRLVLGMAYLKFLQRDYRGLEDETAAEWINRWMGRRAYEIVWKPLFVQKFGDMAEQVAMPWFWSRIFCRSLSLGYLRGGFHQLYATLDERIRAMDGEVRTGQVVESIESSGNRVAVVANGEELHFDRVICTLPTRLFMKVARGLPDDYRQQYDWGGYNGAHCVILALDRPLTDVYWLSIHDPGYPFLVLVEHTNYMPAEDYGSQHLVYLGNYVPPTDRRFSMSQDELLEWYLPYLVRFNSRFDRAWVKDAWVFGAPFAQPIVTVDYHQHIPSNETPLPGVFLANMFQVYPQDRGQNYSIAMAHRVADQIAGELANSRVSVG
jgi:protoporphyrinogen oxidase